MRRHSHRQRNTLRIWSRLQARMTFSFVGVAVVTALVIELLLALLFFLVIANLPFVDQSALNTARFTAQNYALEAAVQAGGTNTLDPHSTFQPGQPTSLVLPGANPTEVVPYITTSIPATPAPSSPTALAPEIALLIAPNGQIIASSYPQLYPNSSSISQVLPRQTQLILDALAGKAGGIVNNTSQGHIASYAQPVLNKDRQPIGAIYVQMPPVAISSNIFAFVTAWLFTGLFWLIITAPIGALFGILTTRSLVRRLHRLINATAQFARGDYTQRVKLTRKDEIGQLEQQFNSMAGQLVESIDQQKILTEQHARLEERARIEQELRTAQYIQRALLPKEVPAPPGWQLVPVYRPAREVGGDFYDFLPLADGRLGIVI